MRHAHAFQIEPSPADRSGHERRTPEFPKGLDPVSHREGAALHWPASWPAELYTGECCGSCQVQFFSAKGARVIVHDPPPAGTMVSLKFPFTIYLKGQVAWVRGEDLGIEFTESTQRSARIVEDVLLDNTGV